METSISDKITPGIVRKKIYRRPRLSKKNTDIKVPIELTNANGIFNTIPNVFLSVIDSNLIPVFYIIIGP